MLFKSELDLEAVDEERGVSVHLQSFFKQHKTVHSFSEEHLKI